MDEKFFNISVGDKVGFYPDSGPPYIGTVTSVTPKCFDVDNRRYWRSNGRCVGANYMKSPVAVPVTPEFTADIEEAQAKVQHDVLAEELAPLIHKVSLPNLLRIKAIIDEEIR